MNEVETLVDIISWLDKRIEEMKGDAPYYKNLKESLEWELKTVKERDL